MRCCLDVLAPRFSSLLLALSALALMPGAAIAQEEDSPAGVEEAAEEGASSEAPTEEPSANASPEEGEVSEAEEPEEPPAKAAPREDDKKPTEIAAKPAGLDELVASARANAAVMDAERAREKNAEWQRYRAKYAWTPKLQADSLLAPVPADTDINDFGNNIDNIVSLDVGPYFKQTARLVIPLYTFGRINSAHALSEIGVTNAKLEGRKAELDLIFQVKRAYYGLQLARSLATMITDGEELVTEQLESMEEARNFGEATFETKDFRKLQIFAADLESRVLDNKKLITLGLAGLQYLTEQDLALENIPPLDESEEFGELATLEHYQRIARTYRPEVLQLGAATQARDEQLRLERANFFPNLFFAANFSYGVSTETIARTPVQRLVDGEYQDTDLSAPPFSNPYNALGFGVAIGMRWNIDFVQQYGKYRETQAQVERTQAQRRQAVGAIELEVEQLHLEASQARARIDIQGRRLEAARRWRDSIGLTAELTGQKIDNDKIAGAIDPLKAYYEAKLLYMKAITDYKIARAALAKGVGLDALEDDAPEGAAK